MFRQIEKAALQGTMLISAYQTCLGNSMVIPRKRPCAADAASKCSVSGK